MKESIQARRIPDAPPSMFYIPNFISEEEEASILHEIPANRWVTLTHRRLQAIPARLTANNTLLSAPLPGWLTRPMVERFNDLGLFADAPHGGANHCLINEYLPKQGIMAHEDGSAYYPLVATISLGASLVLDVTEKSKDDAHEKPKAWRILQEPRSLLVTTGSAYVDTLHGIADVVEDTDLREETVANWALLGDAEKIVANGGKNVRTTRISLTYRDVKKVSTISSKIFGKGRS